MNFHLRLHSIAPAALLAGAAFAGLQLATTVPAPSGVSSERAAFAEPVARALLDEASSTRSYAYYPEQLAALSSLKSFTPVADPGRPVLVAPVAEANDDPPRKRTSEAPRRVEPVKRAEILSGATPVAAAGPEAAKPRSRTESKPEGWKLFGLSVPKPGWPNGESMRAEAVKWRDAAASLPEKAAAFGGHIAQLWR